MHFKLQVSFFKKICFPKKLESSSSSNCLFLMKIKYSFMAGKKYINGWSILSRHQQFVVSFGPWKHWY